MYNVTWRHAWLPCS